MKAKFERKGSQPAEGWEVLETSVRPHAKGGEWELRAIRMPYYGDVLEFVQVDHPDGTASYFTIDLDVPGNFRAGPFGGGYAWTCPRYVLGEVWALLRDVFVNAPGDPDEGDRVLDAQADELARSHG